MAKFGRRNPDNKKSGYHKQLVKNSIKPKRIKMVDGKSDWKRIKHTVEKEFA